MNIIVFEDNLFFLTRLEAKLQALGHSVFSVGSIQRIMNAIEDDWQAVIVDMNASDAFSALEAAKRRRLPVIGFCGHAEVELRRRAKAAGVDILLSNSELLTSIDAVLVKLQLRAGSDDAVESAN